MNEFSRVARNAAFETNGNIEYPGFGGRAIIRIDYKLNEGKKNLYESDTEIWITCWANIIGGKVKDNERMFEWRAIE